MVSLLIIAYIIAKYKNLKSNYILWYNNSVNISQKAGCRKNDFGCAELAGKSMPISGKRARGAQQSYCRKRV